ncbi:hypothetical protein HVTV-2_gp124 [Haloarcula virus HVTV-2]|uniref:Uncharacterized protein n=1 Tax=Haloarcula vallismortis tailed virus 1 TaxID=1262528 RepID=L7TNR8_9CAUD|nr:hypothetical protein HVTV1_123 [Haloarcula vallismortis tailed virus 1]AGC34492.1 hypothetical protein HVTV1_123 [Haloarcula vallismortis tailed virus 1]UBF22931.1 hypothetical protein HVTV-2_gp124 [Haloarcula virus HVTV-2]
MGRPIRAEALTGATSATAGDRVQTKGHNSLGLYVVAENLDTANDTLDVRAEMQVAGEWSAVRDASGTVVLSLSTSDFEDPDGNGTYAAFVFAHGVPAEFLRARITSFTDNANGDLSVDAYVMGANWNGPAREFREIV